MRYQLIPFLENREFSVSVDKKNESDKIIFHYKIIGNIDDVIIPEKGSLDEIWKSSCCELFLSTGDTKYREFNISFSKEIQTYSFSDYRNGGRVENIECVVEKIVKNSNVLELSIAITNIFGRELFGNIAVIIENSIGEKSYWALSHTPKKLDFHERGNWGRI